MISGAARRCFVSPGVRRCAHHVERIGSRFISDGPQGPSSRSSAVDESSVSHEIPAPSVQRSLLPLMTSRKLEFAPKGMKPRQAWLESLSSIENEKLGIIDLHPEVFAVFPRIDILHDNVHWQLMYKHINYDKAKNRAELWGGNRKPWQQKGTGRARHGSIRSPLWIKGGKSFGPRGPTSYFYMLPLSKRVLGLATALSVKYAQNNLHIVDSLEMPSNDPDFLEELIETRGWGLSVLFINETDIIPENFGQACEELKSYNVMAAYGLNVYSMLKHETLVLTLPALEHIEKSLLSHMHAQDAKDYAFNKRSWHQSVNPQHPY